MVIFVSFSNINILSILIYMKQNTILLILFGVILIYYLCKSSREGVEGVGGATGGSERKRGEGEGGAGTPTETPTPPADPGTDPAAATDPTETALPPPDAGPLAASVSAAADSLPEDGPAAGGGPAAGSDPVAMAGGGDPVASSPAVGGNKMELGPELLKKIKELESTITKLKFQTKRARLQGQNIVAVDKLDMGKLSMDLFNWQKMNKKSNVDVNLILGDHIKNSAKETSVKHIISPNKKEKSCDPVADEKEQQPPVEYKGYPVFTKPEFPSTQKYELPKGAKAGPSMNKPFEQSDVNTGIPKAFNTESYDQKADSGIEKSH
jgi:hypothetical protein